MRDVFEKAFGLRDNPFNPLEFAGVDPRLLDDLSTRALEIDEAPELRPLFVRDAGPFESALETFANLLQLAGYQSGDDPQLGTKSFIFRIIGPQGSGKSTLTNVMIEWLKCCLHDRKLFVLKESLRRPDRLTDQLASIRQQVVDRGAKWCCLAFDDVNGPDEPELHDLYQDLQKKTHLVLFAIMHHVEDLRRPRLSAPVPVRDFWTSGLSSDQARRFVEQRVDLFRAGSARKRLCDDLSLFPFDPEDLELAVGPQQSEGRAGDAGSITLRTLNQILHRGLERAVMAKPADFANLTVDGLRAARVKVLELFAEDMRAAA